MGFLAKSNWALFSGTASTSPKTAMKQLFETVARSAFHVAKSSVRIDVVAEEIKKTEEGVRSTLATTEKLQSSMHQIAERTEKAANAAQTIAEHAKNGSKAIERSVEGSSELIERMNGTISKLEFILDNIPKISAISAVVDGIAFKSELLAFNAAIEAARAGEHGRGFHVVAEEISKLAQTTGAQMKECNFILDQVKAALNPAKQSLVEIQNLSNANFKQTCDLADSLRDILTNIGETADQNNKIAAMVKEESENIRESHAQMNSAHSAAMKMTQETKELALNMAGLNRMTEEVYGNMDRISMDTQFHQALKLGRELSKKVQGIMETAIRSEKASLEDFLALEYREIKEKEIAKLNHLFDTSLVPYDGFNPPKYFTRYDLTIDKDIQTAMDETKSKLGSLVFAFVMDLNSYCPSHNSSSCQKWTNDPAKDLGGNRAKRFFHNNSILVRGARVGLRGAMDLPLKASRQDFLNLGINLKRDDIAARNYLVQTYPRDTGAINTALTVPIYVQEQRYGAVILGWQDS